MQDTDVDDEVLRLLMDPQQGCWNRTFESARALLPSQLHTVLWILWAVTPTATERRFASNATLLTLL